MKGIKVSACIITYNQQDFIKSCLEGAVNQVLDYDYEIVIGDDCSTDNTF
jgi:glycosyltransferase involved in cell wall biosynthesis